jgi:hypothetical protein
LKKFVLTNEIALSTVLEMVGLTFFKIQEVTTDTVFYQLVFNPAYDSKDDSPIWYHDDGTQASSNIPFMIYDTGLAAQTALANQLIYHRFDGSLEDLSNVPIFLEGLLGADLCYNPSQKSLFFDTPSSKHVEKARHLLLLLKPSKIPMRIEAVSLATSEALQLQWSEKAIKAYFDTQFNHIKGVIEETEGDEWPF